MAKRFTDTEKWKKQWIRSLPPEMKLVWIYITDDCDVAGLWHVDWDVLQIRLGIKTTQKEAISHLREKIVVIDSGEKWFIPSFIEFQYGPELSRSNNIFKSINRVLEKHNLYQYLTVEIVDQGGTTSAMRSRVSRKTKDQIFIENDMTCQYCQEQKPRAELVVDHFLSIDKGGDNSDENLICCCIRCNSHKTNLAPEDFLSRDLPFLNPTELVLSLNKKLKAPFSGLKATKDKVKDKDMDKEKEKEMEKVKATRAEIVFPFDSPRFKQVWAAWIQYRSEIKKPYKSDMAIQAALKKLSEHSEEVAIKMIEESISNQWQGIFEIKQTGNTNGFADKQKQRTDGLILSFAERASQHFSGGQSQGGQ